MQGALARCVLGIISSQHGAEKCFWGENVTEQTRGERVNDILLPKGPSFRSGGPPHLLGLPCPQPEERHLSMPETGEKERNYLFKSYTDLE